MVSLDWRFRTRFLLDGVVVAMFGEILDVDCVAKTVRVQRVLRPSLDQVEFSTSYDRIEILKPGRLRNCLPREGDDAWEEFLGDPHFGPSH